MASAWFSSWRRVEPTSYTPLQRQQSLPGDEEEDVTRRRRRSRDRRSSSGTRNEERYRPLERRLSERQISMLAIGGIIGPGLLVGSGGALAAAGPAGALLAFVLTGIIVFFVMQSLGELATYSPISGSFVTLASRYIDPACGFSLGWIYWWCWISILCNEYNNVSILLWYWPQTHFIPEPVWTLLFWAIILAIAGMGVKAFGEVEYWLTAIKISSISLFFAISLLINFGIVGDPPQLIGARYWSDPGAFANGFSGFSQIFVVAGTLYAGCESVGVVAGESDSPAKSVPKAIKAVFARIAFFYVGTITAIGLLIPFNHPSLLSVKVKAAASPFTIVLQEAGIRSGAALMNCVIIVTVISAGNSALYLSSRILVGLAREDQAPSIFARVNSHGVPWPALIFSNAISLLSLLKYAKGTASGQVFAYLMSLSGVSTFICWAVIALCHIRFRQGMEAQGRRSSTLPFRSRWYPHGAYFAFWSNVFLCFYQGYTTLSPFSLSDFIAAYIVLPVFGLLYWFWKVSFGTQVVDLRAMDLDSDRQLVESETNGNVRLDQS
ncbi:amino acid permease [Meredithblackwellia eburnea MCA 4105]